MTKRTDGAHYELTQWKTASNLQNKCFYWYAHENRQIQMVDLMKMDLNSPSTMVIQMSKKQ